MSLVLSFVFGAVLGVMPLQETVELSGVWEKNVAESDDPREKMRDAMAQMREGGRPGGMKGGRRGSGGGPRGRDDQERGGGRPDIGRVAETLTLELVDDELHVDDGERLRIYYLDGEKHERETPSGTKLETIASLEGNAVYIDEKMERGKLTRKYELSPDGTTMVMTTTVALDRMKDPVIIRTVYQRTAGGF